MRRVATTIGVSFATLSVIVACAAQAPPAATSAVSPKPFEKQWDKPVGLPGQPNITVGARRVIVSDDKTGLEARAVDDGALAWQKNLPTALPVVLTGGLVFVVSSGQLHAVDEVTGEVRWSRPAGDRVSGLVRFDVGPVIAAGQTVRAWSANGAQLWEQSLGADVIPASLAGDGNVLYAGLANKSLTALDAKTGSVLWTKVLKTTPRALAAGGGRVYFGGDDKMLYGYDRKGKQKLRFRHMDVVGVPAFDDKLVYAALFDNSTAALSLGSGNRQWRVALDDRAIGGPLVSGDLVLTPLANATVSSVSRRSGIPVAAAKPATDTPPEARARDRLVRAAMSVDGTQVFGVVMLETDARVLVCYRRPG